MKKQHLHVAVVNNYTFRCGIAGFVCEFANAIAARGHRVTIFSQTPVPRRLFPLYRFGYRIYALSMPEGKAALPRGVSSLRDMYPLSPEVDVRPYSFTDRNIHIQRLRRELISLGPDVFVCPFADGMHLVWAVTLLGTGIPYVYSERTSPQAIEECFWNRKGRLAAMSGADVIHVLQPSFQESIPDYLRSRVRVVPNSVRIPEHGAEPRGRAGQTKVLLWLGRLHDSLKQCRLAMSAFARIAGSCPGWEMHVVGDGQDRSVIEAHRQALGLGDRIRLAGNADDVGPWLTGAHAYCFSSRLEGMPNALMEAMAAGLPSVAFAACPGVPDLVRHEENGLLVQDMSESALAEGLQRIMLDDDLRERLGRNARESMKSFSAARCADAWEELLQEAAASKGKTVMDAFAREPFASEARLVSRARQEFAVRNFGEPLPGTVEWDIYQRYRMVRDWACRKLPFLKKA